MRYLSLFLGIAILVLNGCNGDVLKNKWNVSAPFFSARIDHSLDNVAVKLTEKVIIFIDGKEVMTIDGAWPPSQVGLVSTNIRCSYNGITLFGF